MTFPVFLAGDVLRAQDMNAVGLWLVKSQVVGTGVSSVTVTGAFSADYQNYRIVYTGGAGSTTSSPLNLKLGSATTNYFNSAVYTIFATAALGTVNNNNALPYFHYAGTADSNIGTFLTVDIYNPFDSTKNTGYGGPFVVTDVGGGTTGGIHKSNTSFSEFTLTPGAGTITGGTIRVYGYRN
jgi:hypothetical protein